ncbi:MAG: iron ABC transporter permease [Thermomicrobiales bacterium]|nr:iron ABC transporter permease [Thermomicrobiales bacterium]MCO5221092.1 iron ABC transporter permease [Thermomicrobiales bacterium]
MTALVLLPLVYLVYRASQADGGVVRLIGRRRTVDLVVDTLLLAGAVSITAAVIAVPLAWLTLRANLPGRRIFAAVSILPLVIPSYVGAIAYVAALGPRGDLQGYLDRWLGIEQIPSIYGFFGAWLILSLFTYPYVYLNVSAALAGLDPSTEDAARGLGRDALATFFTVTLPMLRPSILAGMLLSALYTVSDFGVVTLLRYDSLTRAIYVQYRASFDRSYAAALSLLLILLSVSLLFAELRLRGNARQVRLGPGVTRTVRRVELGRWRYLALGYVVVVLGLSLVLPVVVLGNWLVRSWRRGDDFGQLGRATWNTVMLGGLAALLAMVFAIPVAVLAVRYRGRLTTIVERLTYVGYGLPGLVIGLAFVFIGANYLPRFYQTIPLMLVAYLVRFVPQAVGAIRSSLLQIDPKLEDAARGLGETSRGSLRRVTVPLASPGIGAGALLIFLTVVKELPMTLLLRPTGMETLATEVWTASTTSSFGRAAAPAVALMLVSVVPALFLLNRSRVDRRSELIE